MSFLEISAVDLAVRDLDRVARFYQDAIGLAVIDASPDRVRLGVAGAPFLTLLSRPGFRPVDPASAGLFHTAFLLPTRADLGRWLRHAAATGIPLSGAADHAVSEAVYLADPEGNGIEIYADRPRDTWPWEGDQIVMTNDRLDPAALRALDFSPWTGAPAGTRIGHVHLQVGDPAAAAAFYTGALGLRVTRQWPGVLFLADGDYHHHVAINDWNSRGAGPRDPERAGLAAVTLRSPREPVTLTDPWGTVFHLSPNGDPQ